MSSRKKRFFLEKDEIAVIGTLEQWSHVILVYETLASEVPPNERSSWIEMADWIRESIQGEQRVSSEDSDW